MIVLFTDFGVTGPYVGQVKAVLHRMAPAAPVIDLMHDAPVQDPQSAAYLLAALALEFPPDTVFLAVVDPGVGGDRPPVVARADGRCYVGPGNGLFEPLLRRAPEPEWWQIAWRPPSLAPSFHGRDLFAPVAAMLAAGEMPETGAERPAAARRPDWPDDLARVIYIDHFGNAMTGLRAAGLPADATLAVAGRRLDRATTFADRAEGTAFFYENANGLVEIAVNRGRADQALGLGLGSPVEVAAAGR